MNNELTVWQTGENVEPSKTFRSRKLHQKLIWSSGDMASLAHTDASAAHKPADVAEINPIIIKPCFVFGQKVSSSCQINKALNAPPRGIGWQLVENPHNTRVFDEKPHQGKYS